MSQNPRNSMTITFTALFLVFFLFIVGVLNYVFRLQEVFQNDSKEYIGDLTSQSVVSVQTNINKNLTAVKGIAQYISLTEKTDTESILDSITEFDFGEYMVQTGVIMPDGTAYTSDNKTYNVSNYDFFQKSMAGETYASNPFFDENTQNTITVYSSPIYINNEIAGIVFASYDVGIYEQALNFAWFDGSGSNYIVNRDGLVLAASKIAKARGTVLKNISEISQNLPKTTGVEVAQMRANMLNGSSGSTEIIFDNVRCYVCYIPIGINDWFLLSSVPTSSVDDKSASAMVYTVCICIAVVLSFFVLLLLFIQMQSKNSKRLEKIAFVDSLTGYANYNKFLMDAKELIEKKPQINYAIITCDVDKFKYINDMYGYDNGSKILIGMAEVLEKNTENSEIAARIRGDIFVMCVKYQTHTELLSRLEHLCDELHSVGEINDTHYEMVVAMGAYEVVDRSMEIQSMVDRSIIAKNTVKGMHKSTYAFYDDKLRSDIINEKKMETEMNFALQDGQFEVYYQPKYYIDSLKLAGAEALIRWNHPQRGLVPPIEFIPLFEKNGFIVQLDLFVFITVCKDIRKWLDEGIDVVPISVNLSRKHLGNPNFLQVFKNVIKQYDIPPNLIEFEITESTVFENGAALLKLLNNIHDIGCMLSMDDFGTGYSSLNMLKDIPVDVLKLDREFLNDASENARGKEIVSSIVSLAKKLKIHVVAEGVEDAEQLKFLQGVSCDIAQGYYFSKPIQKAPFEQLLKNPNKYCE